MMQDLPITLSEHRPRRVEFLNTVIKDLGLKNIEVYPHKIVKDSSIQKFNNIITRALETIPETLRRVERLVNDNGNVIFL